MELAFSLPQCILVALIVFAGSLLQATIGFASGLMGIPLMLLVGLELNEAVMVGLVAAGVQNYVGAWKLRSELDLPAAIRPALIRLLTLPLGVYLLYLASGLDQQQVKQLIGLVLLAAVALQLLSRIEPRERLHVGWEWLAFCTGGVTLGFCGMGGPPIVLWVMAHNWTAVRSRAFLFFIFASGILPQALVLLVVFGSPLLPAALLGILCIPVALLGTFWGLNLGNTIPKARLRTAAYGVLLLIALSAIAGPLLA